MNNEPENEYLNSFDNNGVIANKTLDAITLIAFFSLEYESNPIIKSVFKGIKPGRYDSINKVIQEYFRSSNVGDFPVNFESLFMDLSSFPEKDFIEHSMNYVRNNPDKVYTNLNQILETISISRYISQSDNRPGAIDIQNFYDEIKSKVSDELIAVNIDKKRYKTSIDNIRDRLEELNILRATKEFNFAYSRNKKTVFRALTSDLTKCYSYTSSVSYHQDTVNTIKRLIPMCNKSIFCRKSNVAFKNTINFFNKYSDNINDIATNDELKKLLNEIDALFF